MKVWLDFENRRVRGHAETAEILQEIAHVCDVRIEPVPDGFATSTRLYPAASKRWQRLSLGWSRNKDGSRRKVVAVCWHGHYRFMSEVFARFPNARIVTGHATYNGRVDFKLKAEATGDVNRGSRIEPVAFRDACTCEDPGDANPDAYDALSWPENDTPERAAQRASEGDPSGPFVVIENTPGYLPNDDDPPTFDTYADAVEYLNDRAAEYADSDGNYRVEYGYASAGNLSAVMVWDDDKTHDLGLSISIENLEA